MFSTKSLLNPFSALFAKVHQPPPLDRRESQRLLNALTDSFRTHLDREHGYIVQDAPPVTAPYTVRPPTLAVVANDAYRRPTDRHVRAILSNPLFSYAPSRPAAGTSLRPSSERDPMDVFDQAVAKGLMTPQRATGVLVAKRLAIAQSCSVSVNEGMRTSGTARRVVSWLRSSGLERSLSFVNHQALLNKLLPFMLEEGLEDIVWMWLEAWVRTGANAESATRSSPLLAALVRAKVSPGTSLDAGYSAMVRVDEMFSSRRDFASVALNPWRTLSMLSTVFAGQRTPPSEKLFDSFAAMSEPLQGWLSSIRIDRAHLDLHHPIHPDATAALQCLRSNILDRLSQRLGRPDQRPGHRVLGGQEASSGDGEPRKVAKQLILMGTDTVQHLSRTGNEAEAEWVGNVLLKFGTFLSTEPASASPYVDGLETAHLV